MRCAVTGVEVDSRTGEGACREKSLLNALFFSASLSLCLGSALGELCLFCRVSAVSWQRAADKAVIYSWVMQMGLKIV